MLHFNGSRTLCAAAMADVVHDIINVDPAKTSAPFETAETIVDMMTTVHFFDQES